MSTFAYGVAETSHTMPPMGRQNTKIATRTNTVAKTNVLRSAAGGMNCVHHRLKAGRAMMLCWTPKSAMSERSTASACQNGTAGPTSMLRGTKKFPTKPMK